MEKTNIVKHPLEELAGSIVGSGAMRDLLLQVLAARHRGEVDKDNFVEWAEKLRDSGDRVICGALAEVTSVCVSLDEGLEQLPPLHIPEVYPAGKPISDNKAQATKTTYVPMSVSDNYPYEWPANGPVTATDHPERDNVATGRGIEKRPSPRCSRNVVQNNPDWVATSNIGGEEKWQGAQFHVYQAEGTTGFSEILPGATWPIAKRIPDPPLIKERGVERIGASLALGVVSIYLTSTLEPDRRRSKKFSRGPGVHGYPDPDTVKAVTFKIDGNSYYLRIDNGNVVMINRLGGGYTGKAPGVTYVRAGIEVCQGDRGRPEFSESLKSLFLVDGAPVPEWANTDQNAFSVHLTWVSHWDIPNIWGVPFLQHMREECDIRMSFPTCNRQYMHKVNIFSSDCEKAECGGEDGEFPGHYPTFRTEQITMGGPLETRGVPNTDGIVAHVGVLQYWIKYRPSIDADPPTCEWLRKGHGIDIQWNESDPTKIQEFERVGPKEYTYIRGRPDKDRPNREDNIVKLLSSIDASDFQAAMLEANMKLTDLLIR